MPKEVTLSFPDKQPLGSLYTAEKDFPHQRKWIGEARGVVTITIPDGRMLGVALGSLGWEGLAKTAASELSHIQSLDVSTCIFSERSLGSAEHLEQLEEIRLDYLKIGDVEVRLLLRFPNLKTVWLTGTDITNGGLREFQSLPKITNIVLKSTAITDQGIANMGEISTLEGLNLPTQITDLGMGYLKSFPGLRRLDLSYSKISDDGLKPLHAIPALNELYVNDTAITDDGIPHLSSLKALKTLFMSGTRVTDAGLSLFEGCPRLAHLELRDTKCTEIGVARLRSRLQTCSVFGP